MLYKEKHWIIFSDYVQINSIFILLFCHIWIFPSSIYVAAEMHLKFARTSEADGCFVKHYHICNVFKTWFQEQIKSEVGNLGALSATNGMVCCTREYTQLFSRVLDLWESWQISQTSSSVGYIFYNL